MVSLVGCLFLVQASFSWAFAVGHGSGDNGNIALGRTHIICAADILNTDDALGLCSAAVLALSLNGPGPHRLERISECISSEGDCTDATLDGKIRSLYCRVLCTGATLNGNGITEVFALQYCSTSRQWCRVTESTVHHDCCEKEEAAKEIMERVDGGNPFGTFTIPATTADTAVATSAATTTSSSLQASPKTHTATGTTKKTSPLSSKSASKSATAKQSTVPTSSASADIDSAGSDGGREALIASLSVVSVIAAVSMLALVAALVYVRRLSHRNRDLLLQNTAAGAAGTNAANANQRPDSSGERYETMTVHNSTPTVRTSIISNNIPQSHELSPIQEQSESSVGGRLSGGSVGGAIGSRSSAEAFDGFGDEINWGGINGGIIIAELPENTAKQK